MLCADAVSLILGGRTILDHVTATFARGRICVVLGGNGAGKSTLLSCLAGLRRPDSGAVHLDTVPLDRLDLRDRARRIGLLPQRAEVHWDLSVRALVSLGRMPHDTGWGRNAAHHRAVTAAMDATDCAHLADRPVPHLSGGEQARVLFARVLAGEPHWLLADEPLAHLDPAHQLDALGLLRRAADGGAGVVVVLHDLALAGRIADDIVLMREGRVLAAGAAHDVLTPGLVAQAYGIEVRVVVEPDGVRTLLPVRRVRTNSL